MSSNPQPKSRRSSKSTPRPNTKRTGERSEAAFLHKAASLGFGIAKPWGDSERYDFILDNGRKLLRVQIKATDSLRAHAYETRATYTVRKGRAVYAPSDIDFLVAHVIPLDVWYIVPIRDCIAAPMLRFYPHRTAKKMRLEKFREAWHLLQPSRGKLPGLSIHAVAETVDDCSNGEAGPVSPASSNAHVGTAALGCPVECQLDPPV